MLTNSSIDWTQIVQMTSEGLKIADYVAIRKVVTDRFKEIYGEDIDLSTGTADGDYIEMYCLIINNILQSFKTMYSNLDVSTATGKYLDVLCALTNVYRLAATNSTCSLTVTLEANSSYTCETISFADVNGNIWTAKARDFQLPNNEFVFEPGEQTIVIVTCESAGAIKAQAGTEENDWTDGWIDRLVNQDVVMKIQQFQDAAEGQPEETDASLRKRRNESTGTKSSSALNGLIGALFNLGGIEDVKVYNNASSDNINAKNGAVIPPHSVYILIDRAENVVIADSVIGMAIYNSMTPGILTTNASNAYVSPKSFRYEQSFLESIAYLTVEQNVFWGEVKSIQERSNFSSSHLIITITPRQNFASSGNSTCIKIAEAVIQYCNGLSIGENLACRDIYDTVEMADPRFRGKSTFLIDNVKVGTNAVPMSSNLYTSNDEVYDFSEYSITQSGDNYVIEVY